jgi:NADH-dependent peroxiredoxin subunit F
VYDLIIIGAGPAGITASVYAARKRMNFLVISKDVGGQAAFSGDIENYTGYQFISGPQLALKFKEHMDNYKVKLKEFEEVTAIKKENNTIFVKTDKGSYESKTLIIASGKRTKELNVPGEKDYKNKGLTYCATCDGPLFTGKDVVVVGGGNSALDAVLQLINIASHVYLINITDDLTGDLIMQDKVKTSDKVTILNNTRIKSISGDRFLTSIKIASNSEERTLAVQGVFVEIGLIPNSEFSEILDKNKQGEININCANETNVHAIFAAGDVTNVPEKQIIIAAGEGSKAVLSAFRYLSRQR